MFLMVLKLIHFNQIGVLFRFGHDVCRLRREELDMGSFSTQIHRDHSSALKPAASALAPSLMQAERQSHTHVCVHTHTHTHTQGERQREKNTLLLVKPRFQIKGPGEFLRLKLNAL